METLRDPEVSMRADIDELLSEAAAKVDDKPDFEPSAEDLAAAGAGAEIQPKKPAPAKASAAPAAIIPPAPAAVTPPAKKPGDIVEEKPFFVHGNYNFKTTDDLVKKLVNADTHITSIESQLGQWQEYGQGAEDYQKQLEGVVSSKDKRIQELELQLQERTAMPDKGAQSDEELEQEFLRTPAKAIARMQQSMRAQLTKEFQDQLAGIKKEAETKEQAATRKGLVESIEKNLRSLFGTKKVDKVTFQNFTRYLKRLGVNEDYVTSNKDVLDEHWESFERKTLSGAGAVSSEQQKAEIAAAQKLTQVPPGGVGPGGKKADEEDELDRMEREFYNK